MNMSIVSYNMCYLTVISYAGYYAHYEMASQ